MPQLLLGPINRSAFCCEGVFRIQERNPPNNASCQRRISESNTIFSALCNCCFYSSLRSRFSEYKMTEQKSMLARCSTYSFRTNACFFQILHMAIAEHGGWPH